MLFYLRKYVYGTAAYGLSKVACLVTSTKALNTLPGVAVLLIRVIIIIRLWSIESLYYLKLVSAFSHRKTDYVTGLVLIIFELS